MDHVEFYVCSISWDNVKAGAETTVILCSPIADQTLP